MSKNKKIEYNVRKEFQEYEWWRDLEPSMQEEVIQDEAIRRGPIDDFSDIINNFFIEACKLEEEFLLRCKEELHYIPVGPIHNQQVRKLKKQFISDWLIKNPDAEHPFKTY